MQPLQGEGWWRQNKLSGDWHERVVIAAYLNSHLWRHLYTSSSSHRLLFPNWLTPSDVRRGAIKMRPPGPWRHHHCAHWPPTLTYALFCLITLPIHSKHSVVCPCVRGKRMTGNLCTNTNIGRQKHREHRFVWQSLCLVIPLRLSSP